jgi:hypothetical protein
VPLATVEQILRLYQEQYGDFNVRHFHEKLREQHHIRLSYTRVKRALQTAAMIGCAKTENPDARSGTGYNPSNVGRLPFTSIARSLQSVAASV